MLFDIFVHKQLLARNAPKKLKNVWSANILLFHLSAPLLRLFSDQLRYSFLLQWDYLFHWFCHRIWSHIELPTQSTPSSIPKTLPTDSYQNQIAGLMHYSILSLNGSHLSQSSWNFCLKGYCCLDRVTLLYWFGWLKCCLIATRLAPLSCWICVLGEH